MEADVTVVVGTFGDDEWKRLAWKRAIPSVPADVPVIHKHAGTLAEARNLGVRDVETPWVIHLDADDELGDLYVEAMREGSADVRGPMVDFIHEGRTRPRPWQPRVSGHNHDCVAGCLPNGNWLVIGSMLRANLIRRVGMWRDFPVYEDWDLFLRCYKAGATFELLRTARYRAHVRKQSRNRAPTMDFKNRVHQEIVEANGLG